MPESEYRVRIEIDVYAESPEEAAMRAHEILRRDDCTPWSCDVLPRLADGTPDETALVVVDLDDLFRPADDEIDHSDSPIT